MRPKNCPVLPRRDAAARGFTLTELVVALAIAAVLATFAMPVYRHHVEQGHRLGAMAALYRAAQYVEALGGALPAALPDGLDRAPEHGASVYALQIRPTDDAAGGYTLEASPLNDGPMRGDACGTYVLHADGTRGNRDASRQEGNEAVNETACWPAR